MLLPIALAACAGRAATTGAAATAPAEGVQHPVSAARQLVVVTTPGWDSTSGTLRRFVRDDGAGAWRADGPAVPVVVGRSGLGWGVGYDGAERDGPRKHEGDGRSPAGVFPLDTVFGFAPKAEAGWVRLPYVQLTDGSDCVDDGASAHYNTVVDRSAVPSVDWTSAEHMRTIDQYRLGVIVGYNARPPERGRGSCIFLHIWNGPGSTTSGCTAFDYQQLAALVKWLDPAKHPALVQLPAAEYERLRGAWGLPALGGAPGA